MVDQPAEFVDGGGKGGRHGLVRERSTKSRVEFDDVLVKDWHRNASGAWMN